MTKHPAHDARARGTHAGCWPPHAGNGIVDVVTKLARLLAGRTQLYKTKGNADDVDQFQSGWRSKKYVRKREK